MRPNLSLENIAAALAVLGTSAVLAACSRDASHSSSAPAPSAIQADTPAAEPAQPAATAAATATTTPAPPAAASASAAPAAPKGMHRRPAATGQASCGNGNCSADMKKK